MADEVERAAPMRRVLVSGISGAGKTTLARRVAALLELPYVELDALHHGPGWVKRPTFEDDVRSFAQGERWITEDQYHSFLGELLWECADTVIWLDLPRATIMRRVIARTAVRLIARTELFNGNRERWRDLPTRGHPIRWAWAQHAVRRERTEQLAAQHPAVHVIRLRDAAAVEAWFEQLLRSHRAGTVGA